MPLVRQKLLNLLWLKHSAYIKIKPSVAFLNVTEGFIFMRYSISSILRNKAICLYNKIQCLQYLHRVFISFLAKNTLP